MGLAGNFDGDVLGEEGLEGIGGKGVEAGFPEGRGTGLRRLSVWGALDQVEEV